MNARLKAWCERRMHGKCRPGNTDYWARTEDEGFYFYVRGNETWSLWAMHDRKLTGKPTPEKCETMCSHLGIELRGAAEGETADDLLMLATHALSAADGLDPTTALALADEVQARFRYPDITPEWLNETGFHWADHNKVWLGPCGLRVSLDGGGRWGWTHRPFADRKPLAHRGDLLKLMELFGHDWRNPPTLNSVSDTPTDFNWWSHGEVTSVTMRNSWGDGGTHAVTNFGVLPQDSWPTAEPATGVPLTHEEIDRIVVDPVEEED